MTFLLKDIYSTEYIENLYSLIKADYKGLGKKDFLHQVYQEDWEQLELKQRMTRLTTVLHDNWKGDYEAVLSVLERIAPECGELAGLFIPNYIATYGLEENWERNMLAMAEVTQYSTGEFAVRPFILKDSKKMMAQMLKWSQHENYHVRRLSSEGCRPRLPWGTALKAFQKDPSPILPILENLKDDEYEYVTRSVANNLNDISKDHQSLVIETGARWLKESKKRKKTVKHALRTLLKAGNTDALILFGFADPGKVEIKELQIEPEIPVIEGEGQFQWTLHQPMKNPVQLRIEYAIHFLKANGSYSKKVFQVKEGTFEQGMHSFDKKHSFRQMTTRKHYAGEHFMSVIVNGKEKAKIRFELA
ncbi:MAG: DNA alkylation repair protein [Bacteroidota bacterium]